MQMQEPNNFVAPFNLRENERLIKNMELIVGAARKLDREGHRIIEVKTNCVKPTIRIAANGMLVRLIEKGAAVYYMRGNHPDGVRYRKGTLLDYKSVVVTWIERGN